MTDTASPAPSTAAVIGAGPAGLMAAEVANASGLQVDLFEAKGSVGRKFLIAGKGGLNLTHSEPMPGFAGRYGARADEVASSALLPLPGIGLVAVGSRDGNRFYPGMGTLFLRMMGETLATALKRFDG